MYQDPKRELFLIIIISALAHLIILVLLLLSKIDDSVKEYKNLISAKKQPEKTAKVIFKKPPSKKEKEKEKPTLKKHLTPNFTAGQAAGIASAAPQKPSKPQEKNPEKKPKKEKPAAEKKEILEKKAEAKEPKKAQIKMLKKSIAPEKLKLKQPSSKPKKAPEKKATSFERKKLTLADITKGFMEHARQDYATPDKNSNHLITVIGNNFGKATAEQLRHERYIKKLFDCIDVSLGLHRRSFHFTRVPNTEILQVCIFVELCPSGKLSELKIVESSGNAQFDMFMTKVIKDASRSFPPVPSFFKTEIYSIPIRCHIPTAVLTHRHSINM